VGALQVGIYKMDALDIVNNDGLWIPERGFGSSKSVVMNRANRTRFCDSELPLDLA
jgi:hypothetical protein